jgi:hypothetical protein
MEGVEHPHRTGQAGGQRGGVAAERVQRRRRDLRLPGRVAPAEPVLNCGFAAAGDDVEQLGAGAARAGHGHDAGDELGGRARPGGQERGLVHPDRDDAGEPGGVLDERRPVLADRAHHGAPADAEQVRDGGDVQPVLTNQPARLPAGPLGQRRPRAHVLTALGPRLPQRHRMSGASFIASETPRS